LENPSPALFQIVPESPELKVELESDLFKLVQALVADFRNAYQVLDENLLFTYLDDQDLVAFLESVTVEDLALRCGPQFRSGWSRT
jgi:hypothetical protein